MIWRWFRACYALLTPWRILVAVGFIAAVVGMLGLQSLQRGVHARAVKSAESSAQLISSLVVGRNISGRLLHTGMLDAGRRADMDADVQALVGKHQLAGLEVWSVGDGHLIYADRRHPAGETTLPQRELVRARHGAFATVSTGARTGPTFDVFLPFDVDGDHTVDAVVEVLLPNDPINASITRSTRLIDGGAVLVALFGVGLLWRVRRRLRRQEHTVRHDALTGIGNRFLLIERGRKFLDSDRTCALLLLDLDGFKDINDTLGHRAGDDLLVIVAGRLQAAVRTGDTVARLGGDEFAVLLADVDSAQKVQESAQRLRLALHEPATVGQLTIEIEASVGIAMSPQHGADIDALLRCADVAMYDSKNNGHGVTIYDPASDTRDEQQLGMLAELRYAIAAGQLRLFYQPKCRPDGIVEQVEALVRWQHPDRGLLPPIAFMPLAERTSLIKPLTTWVIQQAARQCALWRSEGRPLGVAVNISPRNLVDPDLPTVVLDAIASAAVPASDIELEITETAITTDPEHAQATLHRLHALGIKVSIDDFGVGYTSLSQLGTLPVETLKIDQSFVADLLTNPVHETVVRNVVQLAHDLDLRTVAEGVESHDIWTRLNALGCDEIQGYVLTPPLPPDRLAPWLSDWRARTDAKHAHPSANAVEPSSVRAATLSPWRA